MAYNVIGCLLRGERNVDKQAMRRDHLTRRQSGNEVTDDINTVNANGSLATKEIN